MENIRKPAERSTVESPTNDIFVIATTIDRFAGSAVFCVEILGFRFAPPQALRYHLLRRLAGPLPIPAMKSRWAIFIRSLPEFVQVMFFELDTGYAVTPAYPVSPTPLVRATT